MTAPKLARYARKGEPGYDPGSPSRVYEHPVSKRAVPSVTSVIGMLDKPGLRFWYRNQVAEYGATMVEAASGMEPAEIDRDAIVKELKTAPFDNSAAKTGDVIHDAIDQFIKDDHGPSQETYDSWTVTEKRMWESFSRFADSYRPEWLDSEFTVWSDKYGYAGTADWLARIGRWTVLGDNKTGKQTYPEVGLQLAALANADVILSPDGTESPMPKIDRLAVLHIRPTFAQLKPVNGRGCFETFLALRKVKEWKDNAANGVVGEAPKIQNPIRKAA